MSTETKPTPALLPCPFCGSSTAVGYSITFRTVRCNSCWVRTGEGTRKSATQDWNTRPLDLPSSCSLSHPEIRYTGKKCPLCEALAEVAALRRDFVDECPCPQCPNRTEERSQAAGVYSGLSELCEIEEQGRKEPARPFSAPGEGERK